MAWLKGKLTKKNIYLALLAIAYLAWISNMYCTKIQERRGSEQQRYQEHTALAKADHDDKYGLIREPKKLSTSKPRHKTHKSSVNKAFVAHAPNKLAAAAYPETPEEVWVDIGFKALKACHRHRIVGNAMTLLAACEKMEPNRIYSKLTMTEIYKYVAQEALFGCQKGKYSKYAPILDNAVQIHGIPLAKIHRNLSGNQVRYYLALADQQKSSGSCYATGIGSKENSLTTMAQPSLSATTAVVNSQLITTQPKGEIEHSSKDSTSTPADSENKDESSKATSILSDTVLEKAEWLASKDKVDTFEEIDPGGDLFNPLSATNISVQDKMRAKLFEEMLGLPFSLLGYQDLPDSEPPPPIPFRQPLSTSAPNPG